MYSYCDKKLLLDCMWARPAINLPGYLLAPYIDEIVSILKIVAHYINRPRKVESSRK